MAELGTAPAEPKTTSVLLPTLEASMTYKASLSAFPQVAPKKIATCAHMSGTADVTPAIPHVLAPP